MSNLSWLSYSESERERTRDIISQFSERGTRDELGIGRIRDAFANRLFPGTSTIQTRACYFLFIPWMYRELEEKRVSSNRIERRAQRYEYRLIDTLREGDDTEGIIGKQAGRDLKRLPSNVYWGGLGTLEILKYDGSQPAYHRSLDLYYEVLDQQERTDNYDLADDVHVNWDPNLPSAPEEFPDEASIELRREDALYLRDKILQTVPTSMLAAVLSVGELGFQTDFPWQYPHIEDLPSSITETLEHARNFSEVIYGATLLYNLLLARETGDVGLIEQYETKLDGWIQSIDRRLSTIRDWDVSQFWNIVTEAGASTPPGMVRFVDRWIELTRTSYDSVPEHEPATQLIEDRERQLKRGRAKLVDPEALEQWGGASAAHQLSFRWPTASTHIADILNGLEGS